MSGHINSYNNKTLNGNWFEERLQRDETTVKWRKNHFNSEYKTKFAGERSATRNLIKPEKHGEFFGIGVKRDFSTTNRISYGHPKNNNNNNNMNANNSRTRFFGTSNAYSKSSQDYGRDCFGKNIVGNRKTVRWGEMTMGLTKDFRKMGLRDNLKKEYGFK